MAGGFAADGLRRFLYLLDGRIVAAQQLFEQQCRAAGGNGGGGFSPGLANVADKLPPIHAAAAHFIPTDRLVNAFLQPFE